MVFLRLEAGNRLGLDLDREIFWAPCQAEQLSRRRLGGKARNVIGWPEIPSSSVHGSMLADRDAATKKERNKDAAKS